MPPTFFGRFTERAKRVVFFALREAKGFSSRTIEPEHLLLGLLHEDPELFYLLADRDPSAVPDLGNSVVGLVQSRKIAADVLPETLPLSGSAKQVLRSADSRRESFEQLHVGTEHLLLALTQLSLSSRGYFFGLIRSRPDPVGQILASRGLDPATVSDRVKKGSITPQKFETAFARALLARIDQRDIQKQQYAPADFKQIPNLRLESFDNWSATLRQEGFASLGDFEDLTAKDPINGSRSCTRRLIDQSGSISADLYQQRICAWRSVANETSISLSLGTEFSDGHVVETVNTRGVLLSTPPEIDTYCVSEDTTVEELLSMHQTRVNEHICGAPEAKPILIRTPEDRAVQEDRFHELRTTHRRSLGNIVTFDEIARILRTHADNVAEAVYKEVQRIRGHG